MADGTSGEAQFNLKETISEAFDAWQHGTDRRSRMLFQFFAADMVWRIEGHSAASKRYENTQQFINEVLAPFGARFASGQPFRPFRIRSIHPDGDTVIVVWDGRGVANDGETYENSYAWIMKMDKGKVIDGTAFYDSISFNDLFGHPVNPSMRRVVPVRQVAPFTRIFVYAPGKNRTCARGLGNRCSIH